MYFTLKRFCARIITMIHIHYFLLFDTGHCLWLLKSLHLCHVEKKSKGASCEGGQLNYVDYVGLTVLLFKCCKDVAR